ncbi:hypothetical protein Q9966_016773 [Columba livia]|nr:hypothetical protein Q9966_016773 [Columba livia]
MGLHHGLETLGSNLLHHGLETFMSNLLHHGLETLGSNLLHHGLETFMSNLLHHGLETFMSNLLHHGLETFMSNLLHHGLETFMSNLLHHGLETLGVQPAPPWAGDLWDRPPLCPPNPTKRCLRCPSYRPCWSFSSSPSGVVDPHRTSPQQLQEPSRFTTTARSFPAGTTRSSSRRKRAEEPPSYLRWVPFEGTVPPDAVSSWNGYAGRLEFVCSTAARGCNTGAHVPARGPFCFYPYGNWEWRTGDFKVLVNVGGFEALGWVDDSFGNVPKNAVEGCPSVDVFVGRNRYGLGKVSKRQRAAFMMVDGEEVWYKWYQVLVVKKGPANVTVEDVSYNVSGAVERGEDVTLTTTTVRNEGCRGARRNVTLEEATETEHDWQLDQSAFAAVRGVLRAALLTFNGTGWEATNVTDVPWVGGASAGQTTSCILEPPGSLGTSTSRSWSPPSMSHLQDHELHPGATGLFKDISQQPMVTPSMSHLQDHELHPGATGLIGTFITILSSPPSMSHLQDHGPKSWSHQEDTNEQHMVTPSMSHLWDHELHPGATRLFRDINQPFMVTPSMSHLQDHGPKSWSHQQDINEQLMVTPIVSHLWDHELHPGATGLFRNINQQPMVTPSMSHLWDHRPKSWSHQQDINEQPMVTPSMSHLQDHELHPGATGLFRNINQPFMVTPIRVTSPGPWTQVLEPPAGHQ